MYCVCVQSSTSRYEDFLRVVGVVLGTTPPLEENETIVSLLGNLILENYWWEAGISTPTDTPITQTYP